MKIMQERMASFANIFEDEGVGGNDDDDDTREKDTKSIISDNYAVDYAVDLMVYSIMYKNQFFI